eukprot:747979-Hanusia_phi.AAC.3
MAVAERLLKAYVTNARQTCSVPGVEVLVSEINNLQAVFDGYPSQIEYGSQENLQASPLLMFAQGLILFVKGTPKIWLLSSESEYTSGHILKKERP